MTSVITGVFPEKTAEKEEKTDKPIPSYILHISIMFSDPLIWRRVQVPGNTSLATLHHIIQLSMGWGDTDFHQFLVGKISYEPTSGSSEIRKNAKYDERNARLCNLEEGMRFMFSYLYDAGAGWEHDIYLEEVISPAEKLDHPILLAGEQACPPESSNDIHEYQEILEELEGSSNGGRPNYSGLTDSSDFDPVFFDLEAARHRLETLR
ncbi:MAG: plasmid pRiA4b ORF-3 family protein [Deltaproteobacteria bacterium]|nr:plasmid pRiA4b ORF-3 family protein [Deltaproteobacteria bacterium]